jgi:predicted Rossmann fold flavoprotein
LSSPGWDLIVVGGGPAGLMAAGRAAESGARVLLLEKNSSLGKKLLISGGGRCNFTNAEADVRVLAGHYGDAKNALLSPFTKFPPSATLDWFADHGMPYKVEENQRAFPVDNQARSVLTALERYTAQGGVTVRLGVEVLGLEAEADGTGRRVTGVKTRQGTIGARRLFLATGGTSRPETGSTGDGFRWLGELGLRVRFPEPSLVPVAVKEPWVADLAGLAFPDAGLTAWCGAEKLETRRGKLLFTHFGLSGPMVLNFASDLARWRTKTARNGDLVLKVDLFPDVEPKALDKDLVTLFAGQSGKKLKNALGTLVTPRLVGRVLGLAGADPEKSLAQVTKVEREGLVTALKGFPLTFKKLMDESRAVVSSGGLNIDEVDWRTMACKTVPNLAVGGDLLDINRPSGGFSLQLCWATGWVAGTAAGSD